MPRVMVSIQELQFSYYIVFYQDQRQLGRTLKFQDPEKLYEMLRRAKSNLETTNLVDRALAERRPVTVTLELSDKQYRKLAGH